MTNWPISEVITAFFAGAIAWFFGGKQAARSSQIDDARKIIDLWERTHKNCEKDLEDVKKEIVEMRQRYEDTIARLEQKIKVMSEHIKKLEAK